MILTGDFMKKILLTTALLVFGASCNAATEPAPPSTGSETDDSQQAEIELVTLLKDAETRMHVL